MPALDSLRGSGVAVRASACHVTVPRPRGAGLSYLTLFCVLLGSADSWDALDSPGRLDMVTAVVGSRSELVLVYSSSTF